MVTSNIWVEAGLINGAQGTVVDIVYDTQGNDSLPIYVLVNLDQYNGPPLFKNEGEDEYEEKKIGFLYFQSHGRISIKEL